MNLISIRYILYFFITFVVLFFGIKSVYKNNLRRDVEVLIRTNQSMMSYHGMSYDLTGLGPVIILNVDKYKNYELGYLKLQSDKNVYERFFSKFNLSPSVFNIRVSVNGIHVSMVARLTDNLFFLVLLIDFFVTTIFVFIFFSLRSFNRKKRVEERNRIAVQVAHDIRSPLEVLKRLDVELVSLPIEKKERLHLSIARIEKIANDLLQANRRSNQNVEKINLLHELEMIIREKQFEYSNYEHIKINDLTKDSVYGLFSNLPQTLLQRIVSNVVNNAIEAMIPKEGIVEIYIEPHDVWNIIAIRDNGSGISEFAIKRLFERGFSTKSGGHGLGLSGAKKNLNRVGGDIYFESQRNCGTTFYIKLPKASPPDYFIRELNTSHFNKVIVLDDDILIHEEWREKLVDLFVDVEFYFSSKQILEQYEKLPSRTLLLCDYEINEGHFTGLDVIKFYRDSASMSVLVTNRDQDEFLKNECGLLGAKFLSKSCISYLLLEKEDKASTIFVLIDDDKLIRFDWKNYADKRGVQFFSYATIDDFLAANIEKSAHVYIDVYLGNGVQGHIEAKRVFDLGYRTVFLTTGYSEFSITEFHWLKGVKSKSPSF